MTINQFIKEWLGNGYESNWTGWDNDEKEFEKEITNDDESSEGYGESISKMVVTIQKDRSYGYLIMTMIVKHNGKQLLEVSGCDDDNIQGDALDDLENNLTVEEQNILIELRDKQ